MSAATAPAPRAAAVAAVEEALSAHPELAWRRLSDDAWAVVLSGEVRLAVPVLVELGRHMAVCSSFLVRGPRAGDARAALHRAVLRRQRSLCRTRLCLDADDDVVIEALMPLEHLTAEELDRVLGEILVVGEESFEALVHIAYPGVFPALVRPPAR